MAEYRSKYTGKEVDDAIDIIKQGGGNLVKIDTELSEDSSNAIANKTVTKALNGKANEEGYYPNMTVGKADNLVGRGEATEEEFFFRPSAGDLSIEDGTARVTAIKGNSAIWNQFVKNSNFTIIDDASWFSGSMSLQIIDGGMKVEFTTNESQSLLQLVDLCKGRKVLVLADFQRQSNDNATTLCYLRRKGDNGFDSYATSPYSSSERHLQASFIETTDDIDLLLFYPMLGGQIGSIVDIYSIRIFDLTLMFGAGNEPTTIEEFNARKPYVVNEFAYSLGEVISMNVDEIKSVGNNAYDSAKGYAKVIGGEEYAFDGEFSNVQFSKTIDGTRKDISVTSDSKYIFAENGYAWLSGKDICVCLQHSYEKPITPYEDNTIDLSWVKSVKDKNGDLLFPNGLRSAGRAYDEIRYNRTTKKWEAIKRIEKVDIGEEEWFNDSSLGGYCAAYIEPTPKVAFQALCTRYPYKGSYRDVGDGECGFVYETCLFVKDSAYSDAQSLKVSLQGVLLYYELAEPIVVEIPNSENLNLDYLVWDFGTEEATSSVSTTKFRGDVIYQFNAVDRIRDNSRITIKDNGNIVLLGKEFMPATPSGDAMHYAYESIGAKWNADTNYWEFYDMADITNVEMARAFARGSWYNASPIGALSARNEQSLSAVRFNIGRTGPWSVAVNMDYFAEGNRFIEFINLTFDNNLVNLPFTYVSYLQNSFAGCSNLRRIYGEMNVADAIKITTPFTGCEKLEDVQLYGLKQDISFADSPNLSHESLRYMIENCASNSIFTVQVHSDVYNKIWETEEWYDLVDLIEEVYETKNTDIDLGL